jgi:hypothetical protein
MELDSKQIWEQDMEKISKDMIAYAKNYKCKICKKQPEFAWCEHLLKARANKFRKIIINEDAKLLAN